MEPAQTQEQIDTLEIYVEKSRAIGLGQRLLWHLDKFNKKMKLPYIPDARDFYMQPVNATYSTFNNQKDSTYQQETTNQSRQGATTSSNNFQKEAMYTQDSNTVFYYNDYRVVLLLDFSQSSTTTFPSMGKSYLEKMRDCLGVITENLLFQIKNELTGQSKRSHESGTSSGQTHKTAGLHFGGGLIPLVNLNFAQPRNSDDSQEESDYNNLGYTSTIEEQYESGCAQPGLQRFTSSEVHHNSDTSMNVPPELHKNAAQFLPQHAFGAESQAKQQQKQKTHEKAHYSPRVYLSVIVSGIPPGNAIKIIMHNQKIDKNNLKDLLTNIEGQLIHIEQNMKNNIKLTSEVLKDYPNADIQDIQGSLQAHLKNAQYILDLMNLDAKPLLVFLTDCSNSLFELHKRFATNKQQSAHQSSLQVSAHASAHASSAKKSQKMQSQQFWQQSGQLDASIHRLHLNDTQLISIDLAEENKVCQQFGFLNHENELAYLSSITQGVHLTYTKLMEIHGKLTDQNNCHQSHNRRDNQSCSFMSKNLFDKEDKVKFNISNGSLNVEDSKPKLQQKSGDSNNNNSRLVRQKSYSSQHHQPGNFSIRNVKDKVKLRQINSLQKIMFSRASNYKKFLRSHEITQLLGTNLVTNEFLLKSELAKKTQHWSDMSVSSLLLQNRIVPILEREGLAEYDIRNVGFASLIEFRSKLGFKFQRVAYSDKSRIMDDSIEQEKPIKSIEYRYCVTQNVYITCILSLEPLNKDHLDSEKRPNLVPSSNHDKSQKPTTDIADSGEKIYISYDLYAPSDNLKQINREKFQFNRQIQALEQTKFASKSELSKAKQEKAKSTMYGRLHTFINSIYERDGHFSLLQKIVQILRQACQAYPQLMQSSESAALAQLHLSSKHKYKSPKISAPESVNINQFIEDKTTAQFNQSHMQTEEQQDKSQPASSSTTKHHHHSSKADKEKKKKHPKKEKSPASEANRGSNNLTPIEVARKLLHENKHLWERLARRIACHTDFYQWKCYFRYCMFTIMTQSNRANSKFSAFKTRQSDNKWRHDVDLEKIWIQDRQIERKLFEALQEFANLTINKDTFIHVFTESQAANQYRFGGIGQRHLQNVHGSENNQSQDFGFCLIKLKWIASNIAECHLGFYQVGPKQRLKFIKTMRSLFNSQWQTAVDEQNNQKWVNNGISQGGAKESSISVNKGQPFFCYSKNIPSLLMRLPQRQLAKQRKLEKHYLDNAFSDDSANENQVQNNKASQILKLKQKRSQNQQMEKLRADEMQQQLDYKKSRNYTQIPIKMILFSGAEPISSETTHTSLHDLWKVRFGFGKHGLQPNRTQLFHQHEWRWDNLNEKTNMEFFYRVLQMRLNDGFIIVNRYTGTADYFHLVKVLRAYKERICHKNSNIKYKQGGANTSDAKGAPEVQKNEKVEIVVQYIIEHYNERIKEQVAEGEPQMLSVVKAKLFMEKEASFFSVEKNEKTAISKTGSFANLHVTRGHYQSRWPNERFRTAMSRNSSKSKKRIASLSRDSHLSKGSGCQQEVTGAQSSDTTNESRSGKDFFILMRDYMQEVDQVLRQSTLTYHTMVKNSIKKQVEMHKLLLSDPDAHPLKQQLCYFKNIQASTTRQKKLLEESIREKMLILHSDWSTFLEHQYPESFKQQYRRQPRNESQPNFKQNNQKDVYDDQCFNIDQLMLMSKHLAEQKLRAPLLQNHSNQSKQLELQSVLNQRFLDQVMRIFDDFADWKMHSLDIKQQKSDLFCKLISKRHLLLIQVPTMIECQQLLKQHESIQVHYFKFSQDRIQVPSYIYDRSSIYKYLQQQEHDKKRRMMISRNHRHAREFNGFKQIRSEQKISTDEQQFSAREETRPRQRVDSDIVQKQPMTDQSDSPPRHLNKTSKDLTPPKEEVHNNNLNQSSLIAQDAIDSPTLNNKGIECSSEPENCSIEPSRDLIKDNKLNSQQSADSQSGKSKESEIIIKDELLQESEGPSVFFAPKFDSEASEDAEFEIWQVDQKEQVRWYYDHLYRRSRQREKVEFETKVTQIAKNFLNYLSNLLDKAFTEVVLFSFQYNQKWMHKVHQEQKQAANVIDTTDSAQRKSETYEHLKIDAGDFEYARNTMGYNCFKMDLNFAFLIYFQILLGDYEQERRISKRVSELDYKPSCAKQMDLLNNAQDLIFKETIERNFTRCPVDPSFYIFSHNQYDSFSQDPRLVSRQKSAQEILVSNKEQQTTYSHYQENLKGTQDAYSDTESNSSSGHHKKDQPSEVSDPKEVYRECADLLLEVKGVIKDSSGSIIDTQPINSLSQVFKMAMNRNGLVEELIMKAKGQDQRNRDRMNQLKISMPSKEELKADKTQTQLFLNESQEKVTFDSQASVDLQFSFYTVPRYVGLIQSKNVNFLRDEKEDILVNDDLQEDLLRVCRLFNLFDCQVTKEKVTLMSPLFHKIKKTQIIKVIPYYFKQMQELDDWEDSMEVAMEENDNRVFFYTEIQRRIIYGILRRTYAMVAECVCEMLTMVQSQTLTSLAMVQKYIGHLLYNQKHHRQLDLILKEDFDRFSPENLKQMLAQELLNNKIVKSAHYYTSKNGQTRLDITQKVQKARVDQEMIEQVLFETIYILQGQTKIETNKTDSTNQIDFNLPPKWEQAQDELIQCKTKTVKFWCFFTVTPDLKLSYAYYLSKFKQGTADQNLLTDEIVATKLEEFASRLRFRIRKLLFLQEIQKTKKMKQTVNLEMTQINEKKVNIIEESKQIDPLNASQTAPKDSDQQQTKAEPPKVKKSKFLRGFKGAISQPSVEIPSAAGEATITKRSSQVEIMTPLTVEQQAMRELQEPSPKPSLTTLQTSNDYFETQSIDISPTRVRQDSQTASIPELYHSQQLKDQIVFNEPKTPAMPEVQQEDQTMNKLQTGESDQIKVFKELTSVMKTTHRLSVKHAFVAIHDKFFHLMVDEPEDLNAASAHSTKRTTQKIIVVEKDNTINLIRMTDLDKQIIEGYPQEKLEMDQGQILIEVLGVDRLNIEILEGIKQNIEKQIQQQTMKVIIEKTERNKPFIKLDIDHLKKSPHKRLMMFPINKALTDKLALLSRFKQSLSRKFLNKIDIIRQDFNNRSITTAAEKPNSSKIINNESKENQEAKRGQDNQEASIKFNFEENDEQLLFNFNNKVSEENKLFGESLALLNFGFVENLSEKELDEILCSAAPQSEALKNLSKVSCTCIDAQDQSCSSVKKKTQCIRRDQLKHQFSIPTIYAVGNNDNNEDEKASEQKSFRKISSSQSNDQKVERNYFPPASEADKSASICAQSKSQFFWLKITAYVLGSLEQEQFVKMMTLLLNQAIADYLLEIHINQSFISQKLAYPSMIESESRSQIQPQSSKLLLEKLFQTSLATKSNLSQQDNFTLLGDGIHTNSILTLNMIHELRELFRVKLIEHMKNSTLVSAKSSFDASQLESSLSFLVIIKKISNQTEQQEGLMVLKIPVTEATSDKIVKKELTKHMQKKTSIMKNIRIEVQIIISSSKVQLEPPQELAKNGAYQQSQQQQYQQSFEERKDGMARVVDQCEVTIKDLTQPSDMHSPSSPSKIQLQNVDDSPLAGKTKSALLTPITEQTSSNNVVVFNQLAQLNCFKMLPSIESKLTVKNQDENLTKMPTQMITHQRNFFIRIEIAKKQQNHPNAKSKIRLETFNVGAPLREQVAKIIVSARDTGFEKHASQSKQLARILGTCYALPQELTDFNQANTFANLSPQIQSSSTLVEKESGVGGWPEPTLNSCFSSPSPIKQLQSFANSNSPSNQRIIVSLQESNFGSTAQTIKPNPIGLAPKTRQKRHKKKKKVAVNAQTQQSQFQEYKDPNAWFKGIFSKFLHKKPQLANLLKMEDVQKLSQQQNIISSKERSQSQLRNGLKQSQISASMSVSTNHKHSFMATKQ